MGCSPSREEVRREDGLQEGVCTESNLFYANIVHFWIRLSHSLSFSVKKKIIPNCGFQQPMEPWTPRRTPRGVKKKKKLSEKRQILEIARIIRIGCASEKQKKSSYFSCTGKNKIKIHFLHLFCIQKGDEKPFSPVFWNKILQKQQADADPKAFLGDAG